MPTAIREKVKAKAKGKERGKGDVGIAGKRGIDPMSAKIPQEKEKEKDAEKTAGSKNGKMECARFAG